jgi:drug/metabolite transporter (DMT)-like permease
MPTPVPSRRPRLLLWAAMLTLYLVWGSTYLAIAVAVQTLPPFLMAAVRFLIAGLLLLGWSVLREGRSFSLPDRREWRDSTIVGAFLLGGGMGMVAYGEQTVPSGIAALLIAMMPVWVTVLGRVFFRQRLPGLTLGGIVMGLAGVAILVAPVGDGPDRFDAVGVTALIISPLMWAAGSLYAANRARLPSRPLVATGAQMLTGSGVLAVMSIATGEPGRLDPAGISPESIAALVYLTLIGSLVAFTAYGWLLRSAPLPLVATYAYVNPVVAVALGTVFLAEQVTPRTLLAGGVIVVAVAVIISTRNRLAGPARPAAARRAAVASPDVAPAGATVPARGLPEPVSVPDR